MRKKVSCRTVVGNLRLKSEVKVHEIKGLNGGFQLLNLMSSQECEVTWFGASCYRRLFFFENHMFLSFPEDLPLFF